MKKFLFIVCAIMSFNILSAQKNVLVEEATGTWCQYCPAGIYYLDSLHKVYENVIPIAVHINDVMSNEEYEVAVGLGIAPSANIGRRYLEKEYPDWFSFVQQEMEIAPKSTISIDNQFNEATRELITTVSVTALEYISGNYCVAAIVCEDAVTGPAPQYNQANQFSNNYLPMGGFEDLPNPIPANRIAYDHVGRELLGGYEGSVLPNDLAVGETFSYSFTYTIPEEYNHNYIRVVGLMIAPDATIDNAARSTYINGSENAAPKFTSTPITENFALVNYLYNIYVHDTDDKNLTISVEEKPEWLSFEQYNDKSAALFGSTNTPGEYDVVIKVSDGETETLQSYTIVVSEALDASWDYLGSRAFTESSIYMYLFGSCSYNGNVYLFVKEYGSPAIYRYDSQIKQWERLPSPMDAIAYDGSIAVDNQGVVYIAYALIGDQQYDYDDIIVVKKFENNQWVDYGNIGRTGCIPKLAIDNNNIVYLGFKDYSENSRFFVYKFVNNDWQRIGNDISSGTWAKMTVDKNGTPYVSWVDTYAGNLLNVSKNADDIWMKVGGDAVSSDVAVYYYQDLIIDNDDNIYVAYSTYPDNSLAAFRYNGSTWESLGEDIANGPIRGVDVALDEEGSLYVTFSDMNMENRLSVMKFDGENWSYVGQRGFSEPGDSYLSMLMLYNTPCVFYTDVLEGNKASAMHFRSNNFLYPPQALTAELINGNDVLITWEAPENMNPISYNIYRNDAIIGDTDELSYTDEDLASGIHRYTLTAVYEEGESAAAGPVSVEITLAITENNIVAFVIYPNPADDIITIESVKEAEVIFYSINGQMISQQNINEGINTIDISEFDAGIYFVNVNGTMVKIVKK